MMNLPVRFQIYLSQKFTPPATNKIQQYPINHLRPKLPMVFIFSSNLRRKFPIYTIT